MEQENETRVDAGKLLDLVQAVFETCEMSRDDAHLLADSLVDADMSGVHSHGVLRVPEYVKKVTVDGVDPKGRPSVVKDEGACLVVDGKNSMGQIGSAFAMRQVIDRAGDIGMAAAGVRGSNHCGAVGYFARMALKHDMIGIATTKATSNVFHVFPAEDKPFILQYPEPQLSEYALELAAFADYVTDGQAGPTDAVSERRSLAIIQAGYESAKHGRPVNLQERFGGL